MLLFGIVAMNHGFRIRNQFLILYPPTYERRAGEWALDGSISASLLVTVEGGRWQWRSLVRAIVGHAPPPLS